MVLYFIRKVHVFLQFSKKEYALLINFFSYQRNHTSFHQNPGQAEHFNAVTVIFNFFFNYLNQLHATKSFCYRRSTLAVIREDSSMSSWHSYNYWRRSLLKIPFSTLVSLRRTCYNTTPSWRWMKSVNRRSNLIVWVWLSRELHVSRWLVASF